jgi:hypothetical protein
MTIIRISVDSGSDGREITTELAKHPGFKVAAVFPLGHVQHNERYRDYFVLLTEEE